MDFELNEEQLLIRKEAREFTDKYIKPFANDFDENEAIPEEIIQRMAKAGYLGATISPEFGGRGLGQLSYGILMEEIGRGCSSVRSLITVHSSIVSETILRWGTKTQKANWLPKLVKGETIAAFGLSEPNVGSDAKNIQTSYEEKEDHFILNGTKKWITFAARADLFVIIAKNEDGTSAFLVEKDFPGVEIVPIKGILGTRASMLAEIKLVNCIVPKENLLGVQGMGFLQIVNTGLDNGRYSVACGSLGIGLASLEDSIDYAKSRIQFEVPIKEHQLIKHKITKMITGVKAARLICYNAGWLRDQRSPNAIIQTSMAKYVASKMAFEAATEAVQIHGANGCHNQYSVQRYFRDAKVMEIIEGSSEIQELLISKYAFTDITSILAN